MSEFAWVIESGANPPEYWNGRALDRSAFTSRHDEAVRFARREDAEVVRCWLVKGGEYCRAVEHGWMVKEASEGRP